MASWIVVGVTTAPILFLLNALGRSRTHAIMAIALACVNLPLSIAFTHSFGVAGPALGSLVATVACASIPGAIVVRNALRSEASSDGGSAPSTPKDSAHRSY
jgi:O-antigen/teichoic acid export membrane protein